MVRGFFIIQDRCVQSIADNVSRQHAILLGFINMVLRQYMPVIFYQEGVRHASLVCGDTDDPEVKRRIDEYNSIVTQLGFDFVSAVNLKRFTDAVGNRDFNTARRALEDVAEKLVELGLAQHASLIKSLNEKALQYLKRGLVVQVLETAAEASRILAAAEHEYITRKLASRYMVLSFGTFSMVLLTPPGTGLYDMPTDFIQAIMKLASLFPSDVVVHKDPDDDAAAFLYAIKKVMRSGGNKQYVAYLLKAFLTMHGIDFERLSTDVRMYIILDPQMAIWMVKSIEAGHMTYIDVVGETTYMVEFPGLTTQSTDKTLDLETGVRAVMPYMGAFKL